MSQIEKQLKEMNIEVEDSTDDLNELNNHSITSDVATYLFSLTPESVNNILLSSSRDQQLKMLICIRKTLCIQPNPPISKVIELGILPRLVEILQKNDDSKLQYEVAWVLSNIASGNLAETSSVIDSGAVPILVGLIESCQYKNVKEQVIWALSNIAGNSSLHRDFVLDNGILPPLLNLLTSELQQPKSNYPQHLSLIQNATWCLTNLCNGNNTCVKMSHIDLILPSLVNLLKSIDNDAETLINVCWAIVYLIEQDDDDDESKKIFEKILLSFFSSDKIVIRRLVELLRYLNNPHVAHVALKILKSLVIRGDDDQIQVVVDCDILKFIWSYFLDSADRDIRKESGQILMKLTAQNHKHIQYVLKSEEFSNKMMLMLSSENVLNDFKFDLMNVITNIAFSGSVEQIRMLVDLKVIQPLCKLLVSSNDNLISLDLWSLDMILLKGRESKETEVIYPFGSLIEECNGVENLKQLVNSNSRGDIPERAEKILNKYF